MTAAEVESIVVRLTGDGSSYQQMMLDAQKSTADTAAKIEGLSKNFEGFTEGIKGFASTALSALASIGAQGILQKAFAMFSERESTIVKLSAAIRANGGEIESTLASYKAFALAQREVGQSKQDVMGLLKTAETFKLTGSSAVQAVSDAIKIGEAAELSAEGIIRITAAVAQGDMHRAMQFSRMIPQLKGVKDETEYMATYTRLLTQGQGQLADMMNTSEGVMKKFHGVVKAVTKQLGEAVADGVKPTVKWLTELILPFTKLDAATNRMIVSSLALVSGLLMIGPAIKTIKFATGSLFSPMTLALMVLIPVISELIERFGGFGPILETVKGWFASFMTWVKPIWEELKVVVSLAMDVIASTLQNLWEVVKDVWAKITGGTSADWDKVKAYIQSALIAAEFYLRHFRDYMDLWATDSALKLVRFSSEFQYWFTVAIPEFINWLINNWRTGFVDLFDWSMTWAQKLGRGIIKMSSFGLLNADDLLGPLRENIRRSPPINITPRVVSDLEKSLQTEYNKLDTLLKESWPVFHARRLQELGASPAVIRAAGDAGTTIGREINKGTEHEVAKLDGVLRRSAEGFASVLRHQALLRGDGRTGGNVQNLAPSGTAGREIVGENFSPDLGNTGGSARGPEASRLLTLEDVRRDLEAELRRAEQLRNDLYDLNNPPVLPPGAGRLPVSHEQTVPVRGVDYDIPQGQPQFFPLAGGFAPSSVFPVTVPSTGEDEGTLVGIISPSMVGQLTEAVRAQTVQTTRANDRGFSDDLRTQIAERDAVESLLTTLVGLMTQLVRKPVLEFEGTELE